MALDIEEFTVKFNACKKALKEYNELYRDIHTMLLQEYGFQYNDTDDDEMIDTLDYGNYFISANDFIGKMEGYSEEYTPDWFEKDNTCQNI